FLAYGRGAAHLRPLPRLLGIHARRPADTRRAVRSSALWTSRHGARQLLPVARRTRRGLGGAPGGGAARARPACAAGNPRGGVRKPHTAHSPVNGTSGLPRCWWLWNSSPRSPPRYSLARRCTSTWRSTPPA